MPPSKDARFALLALHRSSGAAADSRAPLASCASHLRPDSRLVSTIQPRRPDAAPFNCLPKTPPSVRSRRSTAHERRRRAAFAGVTGPPLRKHRMTSEWMTSSGGCGARNGRGGRSGRGGGRTTQTRSHPTNARQRVERRGAPLGGLSDEDGRIRQEHTVDAGDGPPLPDQRHLPGQRRRVGPTMSFLDRLWRCCANVSDDDDDEYGGGSYHLTPTRRRRPRHARAVSDVRPPPPWRCPNAPDLTRGRGRVAASLASVR